MNLAEFDMTMFMMGFVKTEQMHREAYIKDSICVYRYPGVNRLEVRNYQAPTPSIVHGTREFESALQYVDAAMLMNAPGNLIINV